MLAPWARRAASPLRFSVVLGRGQAGLPPRRRGAHLQRRPEGEEWAAVPSCLLSAPAAVAEPIVASPPAQSSPLSSWATPLDDGTLSGATETIAAVTWDARRLYVTWADGHRSAFLHTWLRDHCPHSVHPKTLQRNIDSLAIPPETAPTAVSFAADHLTVEWDVPVALSGGAAALGQSLFSPSFLRAHCASPAARALRRSRHPQPELWSATPNGTIPRLPHAELRADAAGFPRRLLHGLQRDGAVLVTGTPPTPAGLDSIGSIFGHWLSTIWGPSTWTLTNKSDMNPEGYIPDTAYTNLQLAPHTDGCYMEAVPGVQAFLCLQPSVNGGATWLLDGFSAAEELRRTDPRAFTFFCTVRLPFHCITAADHVQAAHAVIATDAAGRVTAVTYNNDDRAPLADLPEEHVAEFYEHLPGFLTLLRDPRFSREVRLEEGDLLLVHNQRILHGRRAFEGPREMIGGYISRDQLHSACRKHDVPVLF